MSSITLKIERDKSMLRRHPWIFEGAIEKTEGRMNSGDTVDVLASDGTWLAKAAFSPESQIRARVWSFTKSEAIDNVFFKRKLEQALARKQEILKKHNTNAFRLIAAEADGLPGITIDVYVNVVVVQLLSAGAEKHRGKILWAILQLYPDAVVHERSDVDVRKKEGLTPLVQTLHGELPESVIIEENGVKIYVDLIHGHKTGFYLDQRENRRIAASYCAGKSVLNCFSFTGTFGLYALAAGATEVINVDASESALALSSKNVAINGLDESKVTHLKKDVFQLLRDYKEAGTTFDVIVLDPPKFVDSKHNLNKASRGYKDINRLALSLLNENGTLLTFSCSGLMPQDLFQKIVADAALDAQRNVYFVQRLAQSEDHPVSGNFPEGYYLKGLVCKV
ncbi:class I SAM-dependent rRNA methyltransferase [Brumicola nitratireducens]|uniref:PUA domain-containing protein n=1 Tax=Glaciecola nitratireducens (strain JCM 12485 / KCTC 12276 / FR1064) TaxID=1085623 RepID=G4QLF6_GLANF|nr:class I SAM-dependent methyltransferase [Glaciecola nitratireducens]AEP29823.1 PUA domain-containing protein [Glaciecola nitratireducens FR1064]